MSPEGARVLAPERSAAHSSSRLRVVDVAVFYGERSGGIRTYLNAKRRYASSSASIEHHLIVPGVALSSEHDGHHSTVHALPSLALNRANGYRLPLGGRSLMRTLAAIEPDVILLHDPYWRPVEVCRRARTDGPRVVMVHHSSADLQAAAWPGPHRLYARGVRAWLRRAYAEADAVMAASDTAGDTGREASLPLRFGVHPAFHPRPGVSRGDHVLYVGRISREKGVFELLEAAARSSADWTLRLIGTGPAEPFLRARARRLGIAKRVHVVPFVEDPHQLAREYAQARCVVMPGPVETFGLVALEAAACGAPVVACSTAPSVRLIRQRVSTFDPGDVRGLGRAVDLARERGCDPFYGAELARRNSWTSAFEAERRDLEALAR